MAAVYNIIHKLYAIVFIVMQMGGGGCVFFSSHSRSQLSFSHKTNKPVLVEFDIAYAMQLQCAIVFM